MESKVFISFYLRCFTIRLHRSILKGIDNPPFVKFLVHTDRKTFAIIPCDKKELCSHRVRKHKADKNNTAQIHSYGLCIAIARTNGWDESNSYRVYGKIIPGQNIAIFDFSGSEIIRLKEDNEKNPD